RGMSDGEIQFEISNLKFELRVAESRNWRSKRAEKLKSKKERKPETRKAGMHRAWLVPEFSPVRFAHLRNRQLD
ncbi:MAG TPA: hypothetical protein VNV84_02310, partial [Candidatus Acidoferrales bacterium]|nr:hypothetical protein [Candidatus Acidoferrales bacterium]